MLKQLILGALLITMGIQSTSAAELRIRISTNDGAATATLNDSQASQDFVAQLPVTIELSDYAATEKIAYLPKKLSTKGAPSGHDPSVGEITYYAPWGNLAIFYKDFGYSSGLVKLGDIDEGLSWLRKLGKTQVTIEQISP
ncbi:cyclophilin-like fold protein [Maribrevibacterium harenarium]|uniref:cyclophilin-like fold protein n=1 Tax=Maribrevibacterium harenarium TaxID=2589817 RepID=UPI001C6159F1|nr:cyclophilin-like fold protein [Maribrevibacterium harenarium]